MLLGVIIGAVPKPVRVILALPPCVGADDAVGVAAILAAAGVRACMMVALSVTVVPDSVFDTVVLDSIPDFMVFDSCSYSGSIA